ncbi:hypothetical protein HG530_003309 [Fusarium avenaceum]|nr:hypothetical protein HG530_003309 [Fusarium avenaceum]
METHTVSLHDSEELDDDLGRRSDQDLALASLLGVVDGVKRIVEDGSADHFGGVLKRFSVRDGKFRQIPVKLNEDISRSRLNPPLFQLFLDTHRNLRGSPDKKRLSKMSDVEDNTPEVADVVEVSGDAPKGQMSILDALKGVLKLSLMHDGLARGLREASKALDRRQAHMCVLNENCEEEAYKKLVVALCNEHNIPLIQIPDGKQLGEWAGLCVLDREGNARKVVNCSCVVVKDWGEESQERSILLNYFQTEQRGPKTFPGTVKTHHDDVIPKLRLDLDKLGTGRRACLQSKSHLFKLGIQATLGLPAKRTTLSCLVLRELTGNLIEFDAFVQFCQSLLLLGVLLAL